MRCPVPVNLILDEFNNIGKLGGAADGSDFARTLSVVRSRAIYVTLAVQSLGQLRKPVPQQPAGRDRGQLRPASDAGLYR